MKQYLNSYNDASDIKYTAKHITTQANLQRILNNGINVNVSEGYLYLYIDGKIFNEKHLLYYSVRDAIAYNQLFLCEKEKAVEFTVDITEQMEKGEVWGEKCVEPTENYHRILKEPITPDKIISYEIFIVSDPFSTVRKSNNKIQKKLQQKRHKRGRFIREMKPIKQ